MHELVEIFLVLLLLGLFILGTFLVLVCLVDLAFGRVRYILWGGAILVIGDLEVMGCPIFVEKSAPLRLFKLLILLLLLLLLLLEVRRMRLELGIEVLVLRGGEKEFIFSEG